MARTAALTKFRRRPPVHPLIVTLAKSPKRAKGKCSCGRKLIRRFGWDRHMAMAVKDEHCPNGCMRSTWWIYPDSLTRAELKALGLRKVRKARPGGMSL